jgi:hypothetical protein
MAEMIRGIIYQCKVPRDKVPCSIQRGPFRSLSKEEVEKHEKEHQNFIVMAEKRGYLREKDEEILAKNISTWKYWENLFRLAKKLNSAMERQPLTVNQSACTYECGIGVIVDIKGLIESQTRRKIVTEVLEAVFETTWWEKNDGVIRDGLKHLPQVWRLARDIKKEVAMIKKELGNRIDTEEIIEDIGLLRGSLKDDVETLSKQGCHIRLY